MGLFKYSKQGLARFSRFLPAAGSIAGAGVVMRSLQMIPVSPTGAKQKKRRRRK